MRSIVNGLGNIVDSKNLSVDYIDPEVARPVAAPVSVTTAKGQILTRLSHQGGSTLLMAEGTMLKALQSGAGAPYILGLVDGTPLCAVQGQDMAIVMTTTSVARLRYEASTGRWTLIGKRPEFPTITFSVAAHAPLEVLADLSLTGTYPHGNGTLSSNDRDRLTTTMLNAYSELHAKGVASGLSLQPALVSYRIVGEDGSTLHESSPVMIGHGGFNCVTEYTVQSDSPTTRIMTEGWALGMTINGTLDGYWSKAAARLEVLATPQIIPIDFRSRVSGRVTDGVLSLTMPGVAAGAMGARQRTALTRDTLERQTMARVIATVPYPFTGTSVPTGRVLRLTLPLTLSAEDEWRAQTTALNAAPGATTRLPAIFHSTLASRCGDTILYGNITLPRPAAPSLSQLAVTTTDAQWEGYVAVILGSLDERVVWSGSGEAKAPLAFSPVLCYPSAEATAMELHLRRGGAHYSKRIELTASLHGDMAYHIASSPTSWELDADPSDYEVPTSVTTPKQLPGVTVAALASRPLEATGMGVVTASPLVALTPANRSASAWNFGRAHYYGFSQQGIYSIAVAAGGVLNGADIIDRRGVDSPAKVALGADCVWALADNSLVKVSGNRTHTISYHPMSQEIGWWGRGHGEVWILYSSGIVEAIDASHRFRSRRPTATNLWSDGSTMLLRADGALRSPAEEFNTPTSRSRSVEIISSVAIGGATEVALLLPITGNDVDLTVEVAVHDHPWDGDRGLDLLPRRVKRLNVSGRARRPVILPLTLPSREYMTVKITGEVSADTIIRLPKRGGAKR